MSNIPDTKTNGQHPNEGHAANEDRQTPQDTGGLDADVAAYKRGEPVTHGQITVQKIDDGHLRLTAGGATAVLTWDGAMAALDAAPAERSTR